MVGGSSELRAYSLKLIIIICALIVGVPLAAYAIGVPDKYIRGLFLLMLLIYLVPLLFARSRWKRNLQDRND